MYVNGKIADNLSIPAGVKMTEGKPIAGRMIQRILPNGQMSSTFMVPDDAEGFNKGDSNLQQQGIKVGGKERNPSSPEDYIVIDGKLMQVSQTYQGEVEKQGSQMTQGFQMTRGGHMMQDGQLMQGNALMKGSQLMQGGQLMPGAKLMQGDHLMQGGQMMQGGSQLIQGDQLMQSSQLIYGQLMQDGQLMKGGQLKEGSQMTKGCQLLQGGQEIQDHFTRGGQMMQGSQLIQGGQMTQGGEVLQGSQLMPGGSINHGGQTTRGGQIAHGQLIQGGIGKHNMQSNSIIPGSQGQNYHTAQGVDSMTRKDSTVQGGQYYADKLASLGEPSISERNLYVNKEHGSSYTNDYLSSREGIIFGESHTRMGNQSKSQGQADFSVDSRSADQYHQDYQHFSQNTQNYENENFNMNVRQYMRGATGDPAVKYSQNEHQIGSVSVSARPNDHYERPLRSSNMGYLDPSIAEIYSNTYSSSGMSSHHSSSGSSRPHAITTSSNLGSSALAARQNLQSNLSKTIPGWTSCLARSSACSTIICMRNCIQNINYKMHAGSE